MNQYINIVNLLDTKEWEEALYNNQTIKSKILNKPKELLGFDAVSHFKENIINFI